MHPHHMPYLAKGIMSHPKQKKSKKKSRVKLVLVVFLVIFLFVTMVGADDGCESDDRYDYNAQVKWAKTVCENRGGIALFDEEEGKSKYPPFVECNNGFKSTMVLEK